MYERIWELAKTKGLTIPALEGMAGVSQSTIGKWKNSIPRADALYRVATVLDTTMEYLLTGIKKPAILTNDGKLDRIVSLLLTASPAALDVVYQILTLQGSSQTVPGDDTTVQ